MCLVDEVPTSSPAGAGDRGESSSSLVPGLVNQQAEGVRACPPSSQGEALPAGAPSAGGCGCGTEPLCATGTAGAPKGMPGFAVGCPVVG